ncbi:MAG: ADP-ribosylglycohydrolase family protein, partial [Synergistes sp.]|nr:ADP-ribosylglycohydrolase family protein [Synergistes sp.]
MFGALIGDIVGSVFEHSPVKSKKFSLISENSRFTDDTVMSIAAADALLHSRDYAQSFKEWARMYPDAGYGSGFTRWFMSDSAECGNSFGNGSAMRVAPVGWAFETLEETLAEAENSAVPSHGHEEGIKGAKAVAAAVFLARTGKTKEEIKAYITKEFSYDLSQPLSKIRSRYKFDCTCQGSVPQAITAFLESESTEDAICNAISLGGDADTQACIAGAIAEAYFGEIPKKWINMLNILLPVCAINIIEEFEKKYMNSRYNLFSCALEDVSPKVSDWEIPRAIIRRDPSLCRWWVRSIGEDDEIWAFAASEKSKGAARVCFSTYNAVIFDSLPFQSFADAFIWLNR